VAARLCRLLRDEVTEQLAEKSPALTALAADWRKLPFPEANDKQFADGYAQAVTFGLLMARSSGVQFAGGLDQVGKQLGTTSSLIGAALRLLTDEVRWPGFALPARKERVALWPPWDRQWRT
jgi:hypothetical protein